MTGQEGTNIVQLLNSYVSVRVTKKATLVSIFSSDNILLKSILCFNFCFRVKFPFQKIQILSIKTLKGKKKI